MKTLVSIGPEAADRTLERIAEVLRLPLSAFTDPAVQARMDEDAEAAKLWERLSDDADRQTVLDFIRTLMVDRKR